MTAFTHGGTLEKTLELDISVIVALMRRLKLTEAYIRAEELPKPGQLADAITVVRDASGGITVVMLPGDVAEALIEAREHRQQ